MYAAAQSSILLSLLSTPALLFSCTVPAPGPPFSCEVLDLVLRCFKELCIAGSTSTEYLKTTAPRYSVKVTAEFLLDPALSTQVALGKILVEKVDWRKQPMAHRMALLELLVAFVVCNKGNSVVQEAGREQQG